MDEEPAEEELNRNPCSCSRCLQAYKAFVSSFADANITWIHIDKTVLSYGKKNPKYAAKQRILNVFKAKVCALRNSNGGVLMVHLDGQTLGDRCLYTFDEAVERPLKSLITDGSLFTDVYKRQWLSARDDLEDFFDCIVINVRKSSTVCTTDYNTKVTSDLELESPTLYNLHRILKHPLTSSQTASWNKTDSNESRHLQCKAYKDKVDSDTDEVCEKIWKSYRLREYITAMSNVEYGGSILIGVEEENTGSSKKYHKKGFELPTNRESALKAALGNKLRTVVQLTKNERDFREVCLDTIDIKFHRLADNQRAILEISVGRKEGILFFNQGPTAYEIVRENGNIMIRKMSKTTWIEKLGIENL